jgi:hypothetical protein
VETYHFIEVEVKQMYTYPKLEDKDLKKINVSYNYLNSNPPLHFEVEDDVYVIEDFEVIRCNTRGEK